MINVVYSQIKAIFVLRNKTKDSFKVNGYFQGEAILSFSFLPPFALRDQLLKKNLLLYEKILPFKSRSHFRRNMLSRKANRKSQKLSPLAECPYSLNFHLQIMAHFSCFTLSLYNGAL